MSSLILFEDIFCPLFSLGFCLNKRCLYDFKNMTHLIWTFSITPSVSVLLGFVCMSKS